MQPTLNPGDFLLLRRSTKLKPGQIVLIEDDNFRLVIKRLDHQTATGWWVLGDNPNQSTDSREFGEIKPEQIQAVAVARYWPWPKLI